MTSSAYNEPMLLSAAKKTAVWILEAIAIVLIVSLTIVLAPFIGLTALALHMADSLAGRMTKKRKDPAITLVLEDFTDKKFQESATLDDCLKGFFRLLDIIQSKSSASSGKLSYENFQKNIVTEKNDPPKGETPHVAKKQLYGKNGMIASFEFVVFESQHASPDSLWIEGACEDDAVNPARLNHALAKAEISGSVLSKTYAYQTYSLESIWIIIAFLRGDVKFNYRGQPWAYLREHDAWLVQYKNNAEVYGYRSTFSKKFHARRYGMDKTISPNGEVSEHKRWNNLS